MSLKALLTGELTLGLRIRSALVQRSYATTSESPKAETIDLTSVDTDPKFEDDVVAKSQEIEAMRNKSRLNVQHHNVLNQKIPYEPGTALAVFHKGLKWKRNMLGRYGFESTGINPALAWPTKRELTELKEFERVAYPLSLKESWEKIAKEKHEKAEAIRIREETITANMAKTGQWERELNTRIKKKEAEIQAARERKERLVEEVRRHFGFKVDPHDEKFKEMLEQKEKEDKKRKKEAKKAERAARIMATLLEGGGIKAASPTPQTPPNDEKSKPSTPSNLT